MVMTINDHETDLIVSQWCYFAHCANVLFSTLRPDGIPLPG